MSTIMGVKINETMKVPRKPIRRRLPQIPTRMAKTIYRIKPTE